MVELISSVGYEYCTYMTDFCMAVRMPVALPSMPIRPPPPLLAAA